MITGIILVRLSYDAHTTFKKIEGNPGITLLAMIASISLASNFLLSF
jgi:hypothetical protein